MTTTKDRGAAGSQEEDVKAACMAGAWLGFLSVPSHGSPGVTCVRSLQGEMLDNIELNVMHTVDHVEKARDETKRAVKYKGQARKVRLCWSRERPLCVLSLAFSLACRCRHCVFCAGKGSHD